jgi:hypothetical protein
MLVGKPEGKRPFENLSLDGSRHSIKIYLEELRWRMGTRSTGL